MTSQELLTTRINGYTDERRVLKPVKTEKFRFDPETLITAFDPDKNFRLVQRASTKYRDLIKTPDFSDEYLDEKVGELSALPLNEVDRMVKIETLKFYSGELEPNVSITIPLETEEKGV